MIRSFFSLLLIFFVGFISNLLFASLPDEHNILIEVNETNESSYLNQAVQISVLKILGNHEIFVKNKDFFNSIQSRDFITEFLSLIHI